MASIRELKERFTKLDIDQVVTDAIDETITVMADINREQLFEGETSEGEKIKREYRSEDYAELKHEMNPLPGKYIPDLKLTGAFYRGIKVKRSGESVVFESTDEKAAKLEAKFGKEIYGLNNEKKGIYIKEELRPVFNKKVESITGLNIG